MPSNNKIEIPLIEATNQNLKGYGYLVNDLINAKLNGGRKVFCMAEILL